MTMASHYSLSAQAYVDTLQQFVVTSAEQPSMREALAERGEQLCRMSALLTRAAEAQLSDPNPAVRARTCIQLLAQALTDLEASSYLLEAAKDEELGAAGEDRQASPFQVGPERIAALLGQMEQLARATTREEVAPTDLLTARVELSNAVVDALQLISDRAGRTGQRALAGLLGLGAAEVLQAAGLVGKDIAEALGQAEKLTRLYNAFRDLAVQSYDSLLVLLGRQLANAAAKKVLEWLEEAREGAVFGHLLEQFYETVSTARLLRETVNASEAELPRFITSIDTIDRLSESYHQQANLIDKVHQALAFLGTLPMAILPQSVLLLAAAYLLLGGYAVFCGADYVDAPQLRILNRVPGVRQIVLSNLAPLDPVAPSLAQ